MARKVVLVLASVTALVFFMAVAAAVGVLAAVAIATLTSVPEASVLPAGAAEHVYWYVSRAAGLGAYVVLFVNIVLGLAIGTRLLDWLLERWKSFDLHQFTAFLGLGLLGLHVFALLGDSYSEFNLAMLFVPLTTSYRPVWTAVGIVALYMLLVVTFTFYIRDRIGQRAWRSIHYLSFLAFVMVLIHGVFAGTDSVFWWAKLLYWSTGVAVAVLTTWRILEAKDRPRVSAGSRIGRPAVTAREQ